MPSLTSNFWRRFAHLQKEACATAEWSFIRQQEDKLITY